jgi:hypothetical protein
VAAKVRLPEHRAELATDGAQFLVWKGKTAWLVDGDCRVVWKAEFANRVGSGLMADGRCRVRDRGRLDQLACRCLHGRPEHDWKG